VLANFWPAAFFANEARKNGRAFSGPDAENAALIYNFATDFVARDGVSDHFEEVYFFAAS